MRLRTLSIFLPLIFATLLISACGADNSSESPQTQPAAPAETSDAVEVTTEGQERADVNAVTGQTLYVPVYSHIYQQNRAKTFNLTATLSIRNTSMQDSMQVTAVHYYDSEGNLVRNYLPEVMSLGPLSSIAYVIDEDDLTGGIGANFIVKWSARTEISDPIIEAVMISTSHQQGISFTGTARVIEEF